MIIDEAVSDVQNNTGAESKKFGMVMSTMMNKILYTHLYEDKEKVVLQELSSNALDAHVAAGKPEVPIKVTLPTALAPELVVEDFGIGMSRHTVDTVYTTWGDSTKRGNNNEIGGFGFGSKTPLALVGSYTVETTHKGITTMLACYLDAGDPMFSVFSEKDIGREDGTIVRVPISDTEVSLRMQRIAAVLYRFWDVLPEVRLGTASQIIQEVSDSLSSIAESCPTHFLVKQVGYSYQQRSVTSVAVGPVEYRVPEAIVESLLSIDKDEKDYSPYRIVSEALRKVSVKVVPRFAIGSLELSPSREFIEPTKKNIDALHSYFKKILEEVRRDAIDTSFETYINNAKLVLDHVVYLNDSSGNRKLVGITKEGSDALHNKLFPDNNVSLMHKTLLGEDYKHRRDTSSWLEKIEALKDEKTRSIATERYDTLPKVSSRSAICNIDVIETASLSTEEAAENLIRGALNTVYNYVSASTVSYSYSGKIGRSHQSFCYNSSLIRTLMNGSEIHFVVSDEENRRLYPLCRQLLDAGAKVVYVIPKKEKEQVEQLATFITETIKHAIQFKFYSEEDTAEAFKAAAKSAPKKPGKTTSSKPRGETVIGYFIGPLTGGLPVSATYKILTNLTTRFSGIDRLVVVEKHREEYLGIHNMKHSSYTGLGAYNQNFLHNTLTLVVDRRSASTIKFQDLLTTLKTRIDVLCVSGTVSLSDTLQESDKFIEFSKAAAFNYLVASTLRLYKSSDIEARQKCVEKVNEAIPGLFLTVKAEGKDLPVVQNVSYRSDGVKDLAGTGRLSDRLVGKLYRLAYEVSNDKSAEDISFSEADIRQVKAVFNDLYNKEVTK